MPLGYAVAKFLFRVVAPSLPEILSAVSKLKKQQMGEEVDGGATSERLAALENTVGSQLHLIEHLTTQLQALHRTMTWVLGIAVIGLVLALGLLALLLLW